MNYEPDDMIGMGDFAETFAKVKRVVGKVAKGIRGIRGKGSKAVASVKSAVAPAESRSAPSGVPVADVGRAGAGGLVEFAKKNPIVVGGAAVLLLLVLRRRKG